MLNDYWGAIIAFYPQIIDDNTALIIPSLR